MKKSSIIAVITIALTFNACSGKNPDISDENGLDIAGETSTNNGSVITDDSGVVMDNEEIISENISDGDFTLKQRITQISTELGSIYFDFDRYDVKASQEGKIVNGANLLNSSDNSGVNLKVEGNCDEWGTDEYNIALGLKRAKSVKDALIAHGVSRSRINIISYGESNAECSEKTQQCWRKNRRVDFQPLP